LENSQRASRPLAGLAIGPLGRHQPIPRSLIRLLGEPALNGIRGLRTGVACTDIRLTGIARGRTALAASRAMGRSRGPGTLVLRSATLLIGWV
jgi:hypothetical protein